MTNLPITEYLELEREPDWLTIWLNRPQARNALSGGMIEELTATLEAVRADRGLRGVTDLEYETPMAQTNRHLDPDIDTVFVTPAAAWQVCSSRLVREAARLGGDVSHFVPPAIWERLRERLQEAP